MPTVPENNVQQDTSLVPTKTDMLMARSLLEQEAGAMERRFGAAPSAARLFAQTLVGDRSTITEQHFKPDELDILREVSEKALAKGKNSFGYGDYGEKDPFAQGTKAVINALTDKRQSLAFTLGMARVKKEDDGTIVISDRYHWAAKPSVVDKYRGPVSAAKLLMQGFVDNGLLGVGNVIGNYIAPQGQGREVKIRIPPR